MVKKDERFELVKLARSSGKSFHRIMFDKSTQKHCCTCTGYIFHKDCKHMRAFRNKDTKMIVDPAVGMAEMLGNNSLESK